MLTSGKYTNAAIISITKLKASDPAKMSAEMDNKVQQTLKQDIQMKCVFSPQLF